MHQQNGGIEHGSNGIYFHEQNAGIHLAHANPDFSHEQDAGFHDKGAGIYFHEKNAGIEQGAGFKLECGQNNPC